MISIAAVHGINLDALALASYAQRWETVLRGAGLDVSATACAWDTTGSIARDLARVLGFPSIVRRIVDDLARQFAAWIANVAGIPVVIAHSMGQPLALAALRKIGLDVPLLSIGGPLGHPVWGPLLEARGLPRDHAGPAVDVWAHEDGVAALGWDRHRSLGEGWVQHHVDTAGPGGLFREHADRLYLRHPITTGALRALAGAL